MKKILIVGKNSYIGTQFEQWVNQWPNQYIVDIVSSRDNQWETHDFSSYDSILHVAGIAHNSSDSKLENLYYQVNRDLTYEVAKKAKSEGVKQFIFMSSMIVYGTKNEVITKNTQPDPDNFYGDSKLQAEKRLQILENKHFKVAVIRPPMVYGKGSKGNYPKLAKLARITPIFPDYKNKRSMIYVENLCEFLRLIITNSDLGVFHPQNKKHVETSRMVKTISEVYQKKVWLTRIFNPLIRLSLNVSIMKKVFGNLAYDYSMSHFEKYTYDEIKFKESIIRSLE